MEVVDYKAMKMLELSGYTEGDNTLRTQAIDAPLVDLLNVHRDSGVADPALPRTYLRFRWVAEGGLVQFVIDEARLPDLR